MKPQVHHYLVEQLANTRADLRHEGNCEFRKHVRSSFSGTLAGFRYLNEITQDEQQLWSARMLVALGHLAPDPGAPGEATAVSVSDPAGQLPQPEESQTPPRIVRSVPGPDREFDVHGGKFWISSIEMFDSRLNIRWSSAPVPDTWSAFPEEGAALERDMDGLDEGAKVQLRKHAERRMYRLLLYGMSLADDVGTSYSQCESHAGGTYDEWKGDAGFRPAPPPNASVLTLTWLGTGVSLPLT